MIKRRTSATIALVLSKEEIVALVVAAGVLFAILPMVQARAAVEKLLEDIITVPEQAYFSVEKRYAVRLQITGKEGESGMPLVYA